MDTPPDFGWLELSRNQYWTIPRGNQRSGFAGAIAGFTDLLFSMESLIFGLESYATLKLPTRVGKIGLLMGVLFPMAEFNSRGEFSFYLTKYPVVILPQFGITYGF